MARSKKPTTGGARQPRGSTPTAPHAHPLPFRWLRAAWMLTGLALVVLGAGWCVWPREATLAVVRTPDQNVLLVTIDTLRADALGSYGGRAATPNLDRLAGDGIRYDFAHAHAVVTLPSHTSILTGRYPYQHGVRDNSGFRVPPGTPTIATRLRERGYSSGAFIGAFPLDSQFGLDTGFDLYDDRLNEVAGPADFAFSERRADEVVAAALQWLRAQHGKWFAWVHVYDPHAPLRPPEPFAAQYADNLYAGEVAFTDSALGPLLDFARGATDRPTLVIVTSDHGEGLGDHGEATHGVFAYESTLRVPLIAAQYSNGSPTAGRSSRGRVSSLGAQHVDIAATIFDAVGLEPVSDAPGRSLSRQTRASAALRPSYFEALTASLNRGWAPLYGVLVDRDKYIRLPLPELYDLSRDPGEQSNRIDTDAERHRVLDARLNEFGPLEPGQRTAENSETAARLRSLGYTSGSAARRKAYTDADDPKRLIGLDAKMQRAIELFQEQRSSEAAAVYRDILDQRPDMAIAYQHLAFLQWEAGQQQEAIATLMTGRQRAGDDVETDTLLGMYLSESGRVQEALPLLEHAVASAGGSVDALNALAIAYARTQQDERAIETFGAILKIDPRNAMAVQNIGSVYLAAGRLDAAESAFRRALQISPSWAAAYTGLGAVRAKRGDRAGAIEAWKRAVALNPSDFDALFNLATELIDANRPGEARPFVEQFVRSAPPASYGSDIARLRAWLK